MGATLGPLRVDKLTFCSLPGASLLAQGSPLAPSRAPLFRLFSQDGSSSLVFPHRRFSRRPTRWEREGLLLPPWGHMPWPNSKGRGRAGGSLSRPCMPPPTNVRKQVSLVPPSERAVRRVVTQHASTEGHTSNSPQVTLLSAWGRRSGGRSHWPSPTPAPLPRPGLFSPGGTGDAGGTLASPWDGTPSWQHRPLTEGGHSLRTPSQDVQGRASSHTREPFWDLENVPFP